MTFQKNIARELLLFIPFLITSHILSAQTISINNPGGPFCSGDNIAVSMTVSGTFNSGNTFFVEISDASGSFASPTVIGTRIGTNSGLASSTIPVTTASGTYKVRIRSNDPYVLSSNTRDLVVGSSVGNPAVFGNGFWNVYAYKGNNFNNYGGFFQTGAALNIDSKDYFASNGSPGSATGYSGCVIPNDNHSYIFKRTNFPCGYYIIDIPYHNDDCELIIDGVSVYSYVGYGGPRTAVWAGILGPDSDVEFKVREFVGSTEAVITFTPQPIPIVVSPSVGKCASATATLSVNSPVTLNYVWSPATGLSSTTGATVTTNVTTSTTYTVTATEPNSGCVFTETIDVNITGATPVVNVLPANPNTCPGVPITLTASGATNYTWYQGATVLGTGPFLTVTPTANTTYTVIGDDGCTPTANVSAPTDVTVTLGSATLDPNVFGNNEWRAYAYRSSGSNHLELLLGVYTEPDLNFDSRNRWATNMSPSLASGYVGCTVPNDNFTTVFKRTGFTCGMYQITLSYEDEYWLYIDGALVTNSTTTGSVLNAWRGVLTPNSTIEYRVRERWGNTSATITITPIEPIELPTLDLRDPSICGGAITLESNIKNYNSSLYTNTTYSWTDGTNTWTTPDITVAPLTNTTYNLTITKDGCSFTDAITVNIVNNPPLVTISPTNPSICGGQSIILMATGAVSYTWKDAANNVIGTGSSITVTPTTTTTYTVSGNDGCQTVDATVTVNVGGVIDPNTFGNDKWLAFCYDGNNFNRYYGVYEQNTLSFDTRTVWVNGSNGTPSSSAGYVGCTIPIDQHSVKYKRKGFPCGRYQIDLPYHDDAIWVYIDGVQIYHNNTWFNNTPVNNIWTGFLGPNSEIEFRWTEGSGGSGGALTLTHLGTATTSTFVSPDVTICEGSSTTLSANLAGYPSAIYNWSADPTYITLSSTTGSSITATAVDLGGTNNGIRAVTCTVTEPTTGCSLVNTVNITVDPLANTQVTTTNATICIGESVTLTATGANTYTWTASPSATAGMSATTGNSITVTPTETPTDTVSGSNNCNIKDANITITVLKASIAPSTFGSGEWNVFAYTGDIIANPAGAVLRGNYTEKSISFDSRSRWDQNTNPSNALALPDGSQGYTGCPMPNDNFSVVYKRTNFSCGFYQISIANHDDRYQLYVNGTLVSSSTGCCQTHLNVWSGLLDASSTVEFIWQEGTGSAHGGLSIGFALSSPTTLIWTGGAGNTDWFNPLNWCPGSTAPTNLTDVIIPGAGVPTQPIIEAAGAVCKNIEIGTGALLTLNGSQELEVYGNWVNNGNFTANNGTVHLRGSTNTDIRGTSVTTFYILDLDKPTQTVTLGNGVTIQQAISLNNVEIALNRNTLSLNNPNPNTITRTGNAFINGETNDATNLSKICWNTSTNIDTYVFPFGTSFTEYIPLTFDKKVADNTSVCISTRGTAADNLPFTTGTTMNSVYGGSAATVVDRWWDISVTGGVLSLPGADITFSYKGSENTLATPTANLAVQHYDFSKNDWDLPLPTAVPGVTSGIGTVTAINVRNFSPFVISLESKPLPVSMLYFEATPQGKEVILDWATTFEQNNDYFEIQRSENGKDFEFVAKVSAQIGATESDKRFYQMIDTRPFFGTAYYRLKQVDKNGEFSYTKTVAVTLEQGSPYLLVSPNPTDNQDINLMLFAEKNAAILLHIIDNKGTTVYSKTIKTDAAGYYTEKLNLPQLPAGLYMIQAYADKTLFFRMITR